MFLCVCVLLISSLNVHFVVNSFYMKFKLQAMIHRPGIRPAVCFSVRLMRLMTPVMVAIAPGIWEPQ